MHPYLEQELETGKTAAQALVMHLETMGAGEATIPFLYDGRHYEVSVVLVGGGAPTREELIYDLEQAKADARDNYEQGIKKGRAEATQ